MDLTQEGLAARAGVKFATYRRFEQTGEISLRGLLQVGFALNALSDFDALFAQKQYQSLDDVLNEQSVIRKRGKKNDISGNCHRSFIRILRLLYSENVLSEKERHSDRSDGKRQDGTGKRD